MTQTGRTTAPTRCDRRGFTLLELTISAAILSLLLGAMASAVLIAGHALPTADDPASNAAVGQEIAHEMARDLYYATAIETAEPSEVGFTVADRGHGAAGPETIRFAWSGTPGDPLTRQYNGGAIITVCEHVETFSLAYMRQVRPLPETPRVMLIVADAGSPSPLDTARKLLMESWGFAVQLLDDYASPDLVDARVLEADVVYFSATTRPASLLGKHKNVPIGKVVEAQDLYDDLGISEGAHTSFGNTEFWIVDDTHEITDGLGTGSTTILDAYQKHVYSSGEVAPGGRVLSQWPGFEPTTVVVEEGDELLGARRARGRRVGLPWGNAAFDPTALTSNGRTIMRRAIEWAAAPQVITHVRITLQPTSDATTRTETEVQVLNAPGSRPG